MLIFKQEDCISGSGFRLYLHTVVLLLVLKILQILSVMNKYSVSWQHDRVTLVKIKYVKVSK